ncbi:MAG: hypothetical protein KY454_08190 [Actinobacteria bacterium]|nr:hypothetical protein [Actinomycetota bacterium]MBW3649381.1 hypothetical protein [Actinomycetota bacterium]
MSKADVDSGRAARGFSCNTEAVGTYGTSGGYKVERYVDGAGHECAYYDTTLLFPRDAAAAGQDGTGVYVLDMADPAGPVRTTSLVTPAMQSPHESMSLNSARGLLVAVTANPGFYPGVIDVYDVTQDCRYPVLKSSAPIAGLGHEGAFAPDGRTYYSASFDAGGSLPGGALTAVDLSNPSVPVSLWTGNYRSHGLSVSDDGTRAYLADRSGLVILDVSQIQSRVLNPQVREVARLTWPTKSTPQVTVPVTVGGRPFLIEMDEFASGDNVGAGRIIDISDETKPAVISNMKLEVNLAENRPSQVDDPGATMIYQGYAGHYCSVPSRQDPGVVACTFILSGLRLFDISDPYSPKEIAYFNAPVDPASIRPGGVPGSNYAMSSAVFVPERSEIWYSDGHRGFFNIRVTNGVWPVRQRAQQAPTPAPEHPLPDRPDPGVLPSTGEGGPVVGAAAALAMLVVLRSLSSRLSR